MYELRSEVKDGVNGRVLRILCIDDNPDDHVILEKIFKDYVGRPFVFDKAMNGFEALRKISENFYDLVLLDYVLPDIDGLQVLEEIVKKRPDTFVVLITGMGSEKVAVSALKKGVVEYISKDEEPDVIGKKLREVVDLIDLTWKPPTPVSRRDRITIIGDILEAGVKGVGKTKLVALTNLNFKRMEKYLDALVKSGYMVSWKRGRKTIYRTTEKGVNALKMIKELQKLFIV